MGWKDQCAFARAWRSNFSPVFGPTAASSTAHRYPGRERLDVGVRQPFWGILMSPSWRIT